MFQAAPNFAPHLNLLLMRLDRNNYVLWRSQVLPTVRAHGFDSILEGTTSILAEFFETQPDPTQPPVRRPNPEFLSWMR